MALLIVDRRQSKANACTLGNSMPEALGIDLIAWLYV
jgi:hypothetical protein